MLLRLLLGITSLYVLLLKSYGLYLLLAKGSLQVPVLLSNHLPQLLAIVYCALLLVHLAGLYRFHIRDWFAYRTMALLLLFYTLFFQVLKLIFDLKQGSFGAGEVLLTLLPGLLGLVLGIYLFATVVRNNKPY